mmetsp:Transcript_21828/g.45412  ORF Transcript_21828/g.45412 Transcript_21828/m.45412 type:complete len:257 (-) Transcript_21828:161-931(-)|eukprot:CAMPEP_0171344558 /NCGR_PEP_ID=MMETSP0878-20121228/19653_1 /TAXON_ID=67004 /ORGANISM="Thalassiosira weissflogii, Strain CCMP1336" /LENGTH=256 /DNA_ID=CAMNT_0011847773 /DNA_START=33 /DNA_END=803 /DNA_ORIENTATION=+
MCLNHQSNSPEAIEKRNMNSLTKDSAGYDDIMKQIASQAELVRQTFESNKRKPAVSPATIAAAHLMASNNKKRKLSGPFTSDTLLTDSQPAKMRFTRHFHSPIASLARADTKKESRVNELEGHSRSVSPIPIAKEPISHINYNDVVCISGKTSSELIGNRRYRVWIDLHRQAFAKAVFEEDRRRIAHSIVNTVKGSAPSGRFLSQDRTTGKWFDIGYQQAFTATMKDLAKERPANNMNFRSSPKLSVQRTYVSKAA